MFGNESPTPRAAIITSLRTLCVFMAATTLVFESTISRGGETTGEKGLSLARMERSVTMSAAGGSPCVEFKAAETSDLSRGVPEPSVSIELIFGTKFVPFTTVIPAWVGMELGSRTNTVTLWPVSRWRKLQANRQRTVIPTSLQRLINDQLACSTTPPNSQDTHRRSIAFKDES